MSPLPHVDALVAADEGFTAAAADVEAPPARQPDRTTEEDLLAVPLMAAETSVEPQVEDEGRRRQMWRRRRRSSRIGGRRRTS